MKKVSLGLLVCVVLAACSSPEEIGENIGVAPPQPPAVPAPPGATLERSERGADAVSFSDNQDDNGAEREFTYNWPKEVSAIPALAAEFEADRDTKLTGQKSDWAEQIETCPPEFTSCASNVYNLDWQVVADTPRFLSLSNNVYTYSGGAHGNYWRSGLVWDRETQSALEPKAVFVSEEALDQAISEKACELLNKDRAERRGEPVEIGGWPNQCVSIGETVVFLGSSNGSTFDRLGVYYAPYVAGAYAEGSFEFTLPVTTAVIEAVKPEYRDAFSRGD